MTHHPITAILPPAYGEAVQACGIAPEAVTEFRLRVGGCQAISYADRTGRICTRPFLGVSLQEEELRAFLARLCRGSVHAYDEELRRGYFTPFCFPGVRVGVAGRVLCEGTRIVQLQKPHCMCIRLPHTAMLSGAAHARLCAVLAGQNPGACIRGEANSMGARLLPSTLFYAPPGIGKTTLLRAVIRILADGGGDTPLRVAVLDTGEELCSSDMHTLTADVFSGYPRGVGMAIATRCFSPQVLISDEIGDDAEAEAILHAQGTGVPLIATAHADSLSQLLKRPAFARLYEHRVFARYIRMERTGKDFDYRIEDEGT